MGPNPRCPDDFSKACTSRRALERTLLRLNSAPSAIRTMRLACETPSLPVGRPQSVSLAESVAGTTAMSEKPNYQPLCNPYDLAAAHSIA